MCDVRETARCATTQAPSVSIPDGIPGVGRGGKCLFCHVADISRGELACVASLVGLRSLCGMAFVGVGERRLGRGGDARYTQMGARDAAHRDDGIEFGPSYHANTRQPAHRLLAVTLAMPSSSQGVVDGAYRAETGESV